MQKSFIIGFLFFWGYLFSLNAAIIKGKIADAVTGEELVGCAIYFSGLQIGTTTGFDGTYEIRNLPVGKHRLEVRFISYEIYVSEIPVLANDEVITHNVKLSPVVSALNEVVVVARFDKSTETSERASEKNAGNIINVISAKSIELSPDLTVANVLQRMSGVTIERSSTGEGQYAILRGMDKRYNYSLVNGVKIPSTNNKYRYLPLNLFPSDMVDRLEVTKALTPDLEGNAIGGAVDLIMKDAPERFQFRANLSGGYNQLFIDRKFQGFDASDINKESPYQLYGSAYKATASDFPVSNLDVKEKHPLPAINAGFSVGDRVFGNRLGLLISATYLSQNRGSNSTYFDASTTSDERNLPELKNLENRSYSEYQQQYGLHSKIDWRISNRNSIKLYNAYINLQNQQVRNINSISFSSGYNPQSESYTQNFDTRLRMNNQWLHTSTLQGVHQVSGPIQFNWSANYSKAFNETPDNVTISLVGSKLNGVQQPVYVVEKSSNRRWEHNSDRDYSFYGNMVIKNPIVSIPSSFMAGGMIRDKYRTSYYNQYRLIPVSQRPAPFQNFSEKGVEWNKFSEIGWDVVNPPDPTNPLNYDATEVIIAGYVRGDVTLGKLEIISGARVEHTNQGYILHYERFGIEAIGNQTYLDVLPSAHLTYRYTNKTNFRASYYRAINRPGFLEIVPYDDISEDYSEGGNPELKHTVADNFDLRYELFPSSLDQFMVGLFYKSIKDPIEYTFVIKDSHGNLKYQPGNFGTARNYGVEVDYIRYFRNIGIKANYTLTNSDITTSKILRIRNEQGNMEVANVNQTRPLYGQSEHVVNISLMYKNTNRGFDAQLAGAWNSDRIYVVSPFLDNDIWEKGDFKLDLSAEKNLTGGFTLFMKVNNLLNTPRELVVKKENPLYANYPYQQTMSGETLIRRDYYKQFYLVGIRYRLSK